jgi:nicotinate-nucleotide adenylyltransferase
MFDPPHNGHVGLADAARRELGLHDLVVLVVADPGHRTVTSDIDTRLELARVAFPGARVEREDHRFTVDSVRDGSFGDAVFLVGADEFASFLSWKEPDEILEHVRLGVATRPGFPRERLEEVLARLRRPDRVLFFENEPLPLSSTDVRARAADGEPIEALVPAAVAELVAERGLYRRRDGVE